MIDEPSQSKSCTSLWNIELFQDLHRPCGCGKIAFRQGNQELSIQVQLQSRRRLPRGLFCLNQTSFLQLNAGDAGMPTRTFQSGWRNLKETLILFNRFVITTLLKQSIGKMSKTDIKIRFDR